MNEEKNTTPTEDAVNAAVQQIEKTADDAVALGRKVTALWLGVTRNAIDAAAATLKTTSEMVAGVSESVSTISDRIDGSKGQA